MGSYSIGMGRSKHTVSREEWSIILQENFYVYPGHPAVIAYIIAEVYTSWDEAMQKRSEYPAALADWIIPGAGGEVWGAVRMLENIKNGMPFLQAWHVAESHWRSTTSNGYADRYEPGRMKALSIQSNIKESIEKFLGIPLNYER